MLLIFALMAAMAHAAPQPWHLVFADEFCCTRTGAGPFSAGGVDLSTWQFELGNNGGWGNGEPQIYTDLQSNADITLDPTGTRCALQIKAIEHAGAYTSARLRSAPHPVAGDIVYPPGGAVRVETALWLPRGSASGTWPGFWMFPKDEVYGAWPASGEIDIMEAVKSQDNIFSTLHFGANSMIQSIVACTDCNARWHVYALEWSADAMVWFLDGKEVLRATPADWSPTSKTAAPFDKGFHVVMNLAAGGNANFAGYPSSDFGEQSFWIDYVRVYKTVAPSQPVANVGCPLESQPPPVAPATSGARACRRRGVDYSGMYDVGNVAVPVDRQASRPERVQFCVDEMFKTSANAVFVTTGEHGWPWDNHCWFKQVPATAASPTPNAGYPNGTLVALKSVTQVCYTI